VSLGRSHAEILSSIIVRHAMRLYEQIPHSSLQLVPKGRHMVHHAVPAQVAKAVEAVSDSSK
jgi:pimeloyl-ACP methyl ester carboxylesterase